METTANDHARALRGDVKHLKSDAHESGRKMKAVGKHEINNLLADVEDLMSRVGDSVDPEISRIRAKVESGLADARQMLSDGAEQVQRQAREAVNAGGRYVSDNPWTAVGIAALTGLTVGYLISRR
jgi:ElaB protein